MKVFISADIEGVTGVTVADETNASHKDFPPFAEQMTREVNAACEGALAAGATEILVKDAHWTARNINAAGLPREARLIRGWSGHPHSFMDGLDGSFAASLLIGYHSRAGSAGNPLAHTMVGTVIQELKINDVPTSEYLIASMTSNMLGVPVAFLSGDEEQCREARDHNGNIKTFAPFKGKGLSTESLHPDVVCDGIRTNVEEALKGDLNKVLMSVPDRFKVEIEYKKPPAAYHKSFYPGATLKNDRFVCFETDDWFNVLTIFSFVLQCRSISSKQAHLAMAVEGAGKTACVECQIGAIKTKPRTGDAKPPCNHLRIRSGTAHAPPPGRIIILSAAHLPHQGHDMTRPIREVDLKPFLEQVFDLKRQTQEDVPGLERAGPVPAFQDGLDLLIIDRRHDRRHHDPGRNARFRKQLKRIEAPFRCGRPWFHHPREPAVKRCNGDGNLGKAKLGHRPQNVDIAGDIVRLGHDSNGVSEAPQNFKN